MSFEMQSHATGSPEPIAIVGVGCNLPGQIKTSQDLLIALREGRDLISDIPKDRWDMEAFYDPDPLTPGKTYVRRGGFVQDIDRFDAGFFGISDAEAARMDPHQRMVLQTVWHALEDAGQPAEELMHSNTGVFLAMMNTNGYAQLKGLYEGLSGVTAYDAMGDAMSITAGRVSHFLGLEGPCLALDTACSSSLVALHLARQSILAGECDSAIVVGVNAIMHPGIHIAFSKVGLMSRTGRCAAFDASADGYIRGEGCVAVIIRRQSLAIARADRIHASLISTAINQDGRTPAVTAPNGRSQEKVIRSALARVGINPNDIEYVEAHGTGTPVGDPIEMSAISNVYGPGRDDDHPLYVGSVKSNFGHIEAGAGLLGLAKAALSLEYEEILPSIHFKELNPNIDLSHAPVRVATQRTPWPRRETPRLAGVNSFGYSGTNAHAILQEAPEIIENLLPQSSGKSLMEHATSLVLISAKASESLDELADRWIEYLESAQDVPLRDISFTSAMGRTQLSHRLAVIGKDHASIQEKIQSWRDGRIPKGLFNGKIALRGKTKIAFMFTGQGAQYAEMGRQLYQSEALFAQRIDEVAAIMDAELGAPLHEVLFGENSAAYLSSTRYVQPALFAIEYALADLLRHWGVEPDYVIGHSVGEIAAACFAGMLDLEDAVRFVVARGRLMGALPEGGKMLAIGATYEQVQQWVQGREKEVSIATVNGPHAVVISGAAEVVEAVGELAQASGRQIKELEVSHAFHSPLMDPILNELTQAAAAMRITPARIPVLSNTSGDFFGEEVKPEYWSAHVRQAVLFHKGMEKIIEAGSTLIVEIGPHPALTPAVATAFDQPNLQIIPTLRRDKQDISNLLSSLAALFVSGAPLKLERIFWSPVYQRTSLPLYPFRRERYWLDFSGLQDIPSNSYAETRLETPELPKALHPLLGQAVVHTSRKVVFETGLSTTSPWTDHRVLGSTVFPATAYLEMAARGFAAMTGQDWQSVNIEAASFERPLLLAYRKEKKVRLSLEHSSNGKSYTKFVIAAADDPELVYCRGQITLTDEKPEHVALEAQSGKRPADMQIGPFYGELRQNGLEYGARFANVREVWMGEPGSGEATGRVTNIPVVGENPSDPFLNAVLLDGCLHVFSAALQTLKDIHYEGAFVPVTIQSLSLRQALPGQVWSHIQVTSHGNGRTVLANIQVLNDQGEVLGEFKGLELRNIASLSDKPSASANSTRKAAEGSGDLRSRADLLQLLQPMDRRARVAELVKWLTAEIKDTLGGAAEGLNLDNLPPSTAFLEIGLDSLLVTELQRRIQEKMQFRFKPMQGLDYQSIESLAEYILDEVLTADLTAQAEPNVLAAVGS